MATSGTTSFNLDIDDVIEESFERCGIRNTKGYDLKSSRRSLNLLFSEWGNRGIHLWKVELKNQLLTAGTITYTTPSDCSDVLEAYVSSTQGVTADTNDISLNKIDRSAYAALPNKGQTGQPSQYYVNRQITPEISLYLAPDCVTYTYLKYYYIDIQSILCQLDSDRDHKKDRILFFYFQKNMKLQESYQIDLQKIYLQLQCCNYL